MAATKNLPAAAADAPADGPNAISGTTDSPRPNGAAEAVWGALTANPDATAMTIANAAHVSRGTAKKCLTALEAAGRAVRTSGTGSGRNKTSDTWAAAEDTTAPRDANGADTGSDTSSAQPTTSDLAPDESVPPADEPRPVSSPEPAAHEAEDRDTDSAEPAAQSSSADSDPAASGPNLQDAMRILEEETERRALAEADLRKAQEDEEARRAQVEADLSKARKQEATRQALADLLSAVTTTYAAVVSGDTDATTTGLEKIFADAATVRRVTKAASRSTTSKTNGDRSAPRPLRPLVETHLTSHPDKEFTSGEIAKVLDRSPGAVANALDTLLNQGHAELTCERPRRYRAAPATTDAA